MYNPSPYSPRQEVTTPDAVSIPRCLRAHGSETPSLPDTRYPARGNSLKQHRSRHATLRTFSTKTLLQRKADAHRHTCNSLFVHARERVSRTQSGAAH